LRALDMLGRSHVFCVAPYFDQDPEAHLLKAWSHLPTVPVVDPSSSQGQGDITSWNQILQVPSNPLNKFSFDVSDPFALVFTQFEQVPRLRLGDTSLGPAADSLHTYPLLQFMLNGPHPVSVAVKTSSGETAVHLAVRTGSVQLTQMLVGTSSLLLLR
jgi:hypothetical protein